jgi:hypothetical protein
MHLLGEVPRSNALNVSDFQNKGTSNYSKIQTTGIGKISEHRQEDAMSFRSC